jgi:hypothetical protein
MGAGHLSPSNSEIDEPPVDNFDKISYVKARR